MEYCHQYTAYFFEFVKNTAAYLPIGTIQLSSPSTKELHAQACAYLEFGVIPNCKIKGPAVVASFFVFCWPGHLKMSFYYPTSHEQGKGQYTSCSLLYDHTSGLPFLFFSDSCEVQSHLPSPPQNPHETEQTFKLKQ